MKQAFAQVTNSKVSPDNQSELRRVEFPYCECDDRSFMEDMHIEKTFAHSEKESVRIGLQVVSGNAAYSLDDSPSEREKKDGLFAEYQNAQRSLVEKMERHPEGLFFYSLSNLLCFYKEFIMPVFDAEKRKELYPDMGYVMTQALLLNITSSELSVLRSVDKKSDSKARAYLDFLKTEELSSGKHTLVTNSHKVELEFDNIMDNISYIILNDGRQFPEVLKNPVYDNIPIKAQSIHKGQRIIGRQKDLKDYTRISLSLYEVPKPASLLSSHLLSASLYPHNNMSMTYTWHTQAGFDVWLEQTGRNIRSLPINVTEYIALVNLVTNQISPQGNVSDFPMIVDRRLKNTMELFDNIIKLYGIDAEQRRVLLSEEGIVGFFYKYTLHYHGHGDQVSKLLESLFDIANTPILRSTFMHSIMGCLNQPVVKARDPKFTAYRENVALVFQSIIRHDPLYCFTASSYGEAIIELFYKLDICQDERGLLFSAMLSEDTKLKYVLYANYILYDYILPIGSRSIYKKVIADEPRMQEVLNKIVFTKLGIDLISSQMTNVRSRLDMMLNFCSKEECDSFIAELLDIKTSTPYSNIKEVLFHSSRDAAGNSKSTYSNFAENRFRKILDKGSREVLRLIPRVFTAKKSSLKKYYLRQTLLYLLGDGRYEDVNFLYGLEPERFDEYLADNEEFLAFVENKILGLDDDKAAELIRALDNAPALRKIAENLSDPLLKSQHQFEKLTKQYSDLNIRLQDALEAVGKIDNYKQNITNLEATLEKYKKQIEELKKSAEEVPAQRREIEDLKRLLKVSQQETLASNRENEKLVKQLSAKKDNDGEVASLTLRLSEELQSKQDLERQLSELGQSNAQLRSSLLDVTTERSAMSQDVIKLRKERDELFWSSQDQFEVVDRRSKKEAVKRDAKSLASLRDELAVVTRANEKLRQEAARQKLLLEQSKKSELASEAKVVALKSKLKVQLEKFEAEEIQRQKQVDHDIGKIAEEKSGLEKDLASLQAKLREALSDKVGLMNELSTQETLRSDAEVKASELEKSQVVSSQRQQQADSEVESVLRSRSDELIEGIIRSRVGYFRLEKEGDSATIQSDDTTILHSLNLLFFKKVSLFLDYNDPPCLRILDLTQFYDHIKDLYQYELGDIGVSVSDIVESFYERLNETCNTFSQGQVIGHAAAYQQMSQSEGLAQGGYAVHTK